MSGPRRGTARFDPAAPKSTDVAPLTPAPGIIVTPSGGSGRGPSEQDLADATGAVIGGGVQNGVSVVYHSTTRVADFTNTDKGSTAVTGHLAATDPHGDRAYTDTKVNAIKTYSRGACWVGGGAAIVTPADDVELRVPRTGTIVGWTIVTQGGTGSCVVDIWRDSFANYPPTVADSICGGNPPTVNTNIKASTTVLTGWNTAVTAGDILFFHLSSCAIFTRVVVILDIQ